MINKKWLIASVFIPIFGIVINFLLLYIYYIKQKTTEYPKQLFLCGLLCGATFFIMFVLSGLLLRFIDDVSSFSMSSNLGMILAFIVAGIVMNVIFVIYYKRKIENK
ncbi:MAG: hypothetical protein J1F66_03820 [Clostridiales bacterium]|nr:hypothetical protein [Clostridiales bacterium]